MDECIVVAYDDTPAARAALDWAVDYATGRVAEVVMVHAVSSAAEWELAAAQINPDPIRHRVERLLCTEWSRPLRAAGVAHRTGRLVVGRPSDVILQCARREDATLIVLGMSSHGTLHELVAAGTGRHILHDARRPVVAVPARSRSETPEPSNVAQRRTGSRPRRRGGMRRARAGTLAQ